MELENKIEMDISHRNMLVDIIENTTENYKLCPINFDCEEFKRNKCDVIRSQNFKNCENLYRNLFYQTHLIDELVTAWYLDKYPERLQEDYFTKPYYDRVRFKYMKNEK